MQGIFRLYIVPTAEVRFNAVGNAGLLELALSVPCSLSTLAWYTRAVSWYPWAVSIFFAIIHGKEH